MRPIKPSESSTSPQLRYLGQSAKRTLRRYRTVTLEHCDLVNEGWLAWVERKATGSADPDCYSYAEHHMETLCEIDWRLAHRPSVIDRHRGIRRLTPGDWRALHTWLVRELSHAPQQLRAMQLLYRGRSVEEVSRDLGVSLSRARMLRVAAIKRLRAAVA